MEPSWNRLPFCVQTLPGLLTTQNFLKPFACQFLRRKQLPKGPPKYNWYNLQRGGMQLSQRKKVQAMSQQRVVASSEGATEAETEVLPLRMLEGWELVHLHHSAKL